MILVDTSVWVNHLRRHDAELRKLLENGMVLCHPWIVGELACGNLNRRTEILGLLENLPVAEVASHTDVLEFIQLRRLMGRGVCYVDVHLLASALLSHVPLWTADKPLGRVTTDLGVAYP